MTENGTKDAKQRDGMPRIMTGLTVLLWIAVCLLAKIVGKDIRLALLPVYGLYPGPGLSGAQGYSPTLIHTWAIGIGVVFAILAWLGLIRRNNRAATAFVVLFVASTLAGFLRLMSAMNQIH
jgi:hypothetical protein